MLSVCILRYGQQKRALVIDMLLQYIQLGKLDEIKELLDQEGVESAADAFCHPLCSCEKCTSLVEK